ncbi:hypothetical protein [Methylomusa anaerophila]|uniref:hypothetical protein n=1 Tax=Methylomusa anaerophila TaxID=1930071 RepID=UPI0011AE6661|nr:hypothetical protein [Methylomusa anaerophila]
MNQQKIKSRSAKAERLTSKLLARNASGYNFAALGALDVSLLIGWFHDPPATRMNQHVGTHICTSLNG